MEDFELRGSGWNLDEIRLLQLRINKYELSTGVTYRDLPEIIKKKRSIINVKYKDKKCFMWSVLSAIHPVEKRSSKSVEI